MQIPVTTRPLASGQSLPINVPLSARISRERGQHKSLSGVMGNLIFRSQSVPKNLHMISRHMPEKQDAVDHEASRLRDFISRQQLFGKSESVSPSRRSKDTTDLNADLKSSPLSFPSQQEQEDVFSFHDEEALFSFSPGADRVYSLAPSPPSSVWEMASDSSGVFRDAGRLGLKGDFKDAFPESLGGPSSGLGATRDAFLLSDMYPVGRGGMDESKEREEVVSNASGRDIFEDVQPGNFFLLEE